MTSSSDARRSGARVGPYEIVSRLGTGGMGEVYRARDTRLHRDVALKMLSEELAADRHRLKRFEQEARAASMLSHPNIVTVFEIGESEAGVYIAMELIEGQTLRQLLKPGGLPTRKLLDLAAQVAEGLASAHAAGIVHRDLKPDNVMVTADGLAKILDFGLAKLTRSPLERGAAPDEGTLPMPTQPGALVGTVRYMSPEQAGGTSADFQSDQFAFGSMLYEMATGRPAFERPTTVDTLAAILHDEPEPIAANGRVPAPLRWIVERCHAKDPKSRYASTEDLARDLTLLRQRLSDLGSPVPGLAVPRRRRTVGPLLATTALLTVALVAGWFWMRGRKTTEPPRFRQLTFRNGHVESARFALGGQTVVYAAYWDSQPIEIFLGRSEGPEFRPVGMPGADILAVSTSGEMAVSLHRRWYEPFKLIGTLARVGIASPGAPREVLEDVFWADWSPDGRELAVVRQEGGRSRLEFPIGRVLYEEKAGYLSHPRVSRDGEWVAFLEHPAVADDAGGVAVVDRTGNRKALVTGFAAVWGLAWSPDGREVWFTGAPTGIARALYAVDLSGHRRVLARVAGSIRLDDVAASGRVLLTHEHIKQRLVALGAGDARERDLSWLDYSLAEAISPDGREILFVEGGEGGGPGYSAFLRRTDGSPAIRLGEGTPLGFSPDRKWVLARIETAGAPRFVLYPIGAGEPRPLPSNGVRVIGGDFMPDGKRILFWGREEGRGVRLYLQELAGGVPRAISPEGFRGYAGGISPDGQVVTALGPRDGIFLYPVEGGEPRELPAFTEDDAPGGWTSDGRYLYVVGAGGRPRRVDRLEVATGRREPWKELTPDDPEGSATAIRLTPDGRHYAYTYRRDASDLFLVDGLK